MHLSVFLNVYLCTTYMASAQRGQKMVSDPLKVELQL